MSLLFTLTCVVAVLLGYAPWVQCGLPNRILGISTPELLIDQNSPSLAERLDWRDRPQGYVDRDNLTFTIQVIYPAASDTDDIGLRGNGLGFSWDETALLKKVSTHTWAIEVVYRETDAGASCQDSLTSAPCDSQTLIAVGEDFIFRAVLMHQVTPAEKKVETTMLGYDYRIPLPLSETSPAFDESEHPSFEVYPWFFNTVGETVTVDLESRHPEVGRRRLSVYLPPSLKENPKPEYDVTVGFDLSEDVMRPTFADVFDYAFAEGGTAQESVIIGFGDFDMSINADRTRLLTPVGGPFYECLEGSIFQDFCNGCIPSNSTVEEFMWLILFGGCGKVEPLEGYLDLTLDFILEEVTPAIEGGVVQPRGSRLTRDRERTMIFGYSLGGLASCYALWTRPEIFGRGVCQSSSFWWPLNIDFEAQRWGSDYYFLNTTMASNLEHRPRQWTLIDVGSGEEDDKMHMMLAAQAVYETMGASGFFWPNENLWFHSYPGEVHTYEAWRARTWSALNVMSIGRHYPAAR